jgi:hypothetical protein
MTEAPGGRALEALASIVVALEDIASTVAYLIGAAVSGGKFYTVELSYGIYVVKLA